MELHAPEAVETGVLEVATERLGKEMQEPQHLRIAVLAVVGLALMARLPVGAADQAL